MSRADALERLEAFLPNAGSMYGRMRNYDFGRDRREHVSLLSPYIRHRLVLEQEILNATLLRHSLSTASKFVQEVFWRTYFKGWLEHHPTVWADYRDAVACERNELDRNSSLRENYEAAVNARTGIECFDAWARELVETGYLHNHVRMWFASIWVYTLELPWALGADFFYRHLLDGDPASNTCSWRWVCGLHTRGKTYLARASNIARYTDGCFNPEGQLAGSAPPLRDSRTHFPRALPAAKHLDSGLDYTLLITEEDCCPESLAGIGHPGNMIGALFTQARSPLPVGKPAADFARTAVTDAIGRAADAFGHCPGEIQIAGSTAEITKWVADQHIDAVVTAYAPVGPVAEALAELEGQLAELGIRLLQIRRGYDDASWPHASGGYFKMRKRIPDILARLEISTSAPHQAAI